MEYNIYTYDKILKNCHKRMIRPKPVTTVPWLAWPGDKDCGRLRNGAGRSPEGTAVIGIY